jgi:hypothetical protein
VLIYISTNFLAPIPCIFLRIDDFLFQFPPKSTKKRSFSQKSPNRLKPDLRPAKAGPLLHPTGQGRLAPLLRLVHSAPFPLVLAPPCSLSTAQWPPSSSQPRPCQATATQLLASGSASPSHHAASPFRLSSASLQLAPNHAPASLAGGRPPASTTSPSTTAPAPPLIGKRCPIFRSDLDMSIWWVEFVLDDPTTRAKLVRQCNR